jgi:hypothetical protein
MESKCVCYTVVIHGLYQDIARITTLAYSLQKGTNI